MTASAAQRQSTVRAELLARARVDDRVTGAALTGSAAGGTDDRWSELEHTDAQVAARLRPLLLDMSGVAGTA